MKIQYQDELVDTAAKSVAEFLASQNVDAAKAIVDFNGEIFPPGSDLNSIAVKPGDKLDVFKMTAGG